MQYFAANRGRLGPQYILFRLHNPIADEMNVPQMYVDFLYSNEFLSIIDNAYERAISELKKNMTSVKNITRKLQRQSALNEEISDHVYFRSIAVRRRGRDLRLHRIRHGPVPGLRARIVGPYPDLLRHFLCDPERDPARVHVLFQQAHDRVGNDHQPVPSGICGGIHGPDSGQGISFAVCFPEDRPDDICPDPVFTGSFSVFCRGNGRLGV